MKCKNCVHRIIKIRGKWHHNPYLPSCCGYGTCEWNCGCHNPEPKEVGE